jgi:pimeloyl-ACP methyl ester carboxylesterase
VVILNTGIIHRVGHHRMYVSLSRVLARLGYTVFRFDLSGIGDSESRRKALPPWESVVADIGEVADWIETTLGTRHMILMGLCSGADQAVFYGSSDPRVVGLVLMDPTIPPTLRYHLHHYGRRLLRLRSWLGAALRLMRTLGSLANLLRVRGWKDLKALIVREPEVHRFFEGLYQRSVDKGTQMLTILTSSPEERYAYREQLTDAFPEIRFEGVLRLELFKDCDHVFSYESDRIRLTNLICEWIRETPFSMSSQKLRATSAAFLPFCLPSASYSLLTCCANFAV